MRRQSILVFVAAAIFLAGGVGPNLGLAVLAVSVFLLGSALTWRPGEPPILYFMFLYQWMQFSLLIFYANISGSAVQSLSTKGGDVDLSIILSQIALLSLTVGMRLGVGGRGMSISQQARAIAYTQPLGYFFRLYLLAFAIAFTADTVAYVIPGLSQVFLAIARMRWAFFFMLAYASYILVQEKRWFFYSAFLLELFWGIGGFFADFKSVFIFTLLAALAANARVSLIAGVGIGSLIAVLLSFGVVWTAVKPEYLAFITHGEGQVVAVGTSERLSKLSELIGSLDADAIDKGLEGLVRRVTYVEYFAVTLTTVPQYVPYEDGAIWLDAVSRPLMPRLFFSDKSAIDDSERTSKYTGLDISGSEQGTSISIGYVGESYIDFGQIGMMVPILVLGFAYGFFVRWTVTAGNAGPLFGVGLCAAVLYDLMPGESSITKVLGGFAVSVLVTWLIRKYVTKLYFPAILSVPCKFYT